MDAVTVVLEWHQALNAGDLERLVALSADDVEVGGPRGSGRGRQLLREWFGRAGIRMVPRRAFAVGEAVVVEQAAAWGDGGEEQVVATAFEVSAGLVQRVVRYDQLDAALLAAGLTEADEKTSRT